LATVIPANWCQEAGLVCDLHERLENEKADNDRLDEKEDRVELMIALVSRDGSSR
jgi:hypothetical protein